MGRSAIDLFAGAGGATQGLKDSGFDVIAAVENDPVAAASYGLNHAGVALAVDDIRALDTHRLRQFLGLRPGELDLLKACPPCQGFSSLARGEVDQARNDLVLDTYRFVAEFRPAAVLLENVPGLDKDSRLATLLGEIAQLGYVSRRYRVDAQDFGVPQRRRRLIVLALRADIASELPADAVTSVPRVFDRSRRTAGMALEALSAHRAATEVPDSLDRARKSKPTVAARIAALPVNGTRFDLPVEHQLACHASFDKPGGRRGATASYGRVRADGPAPTMTTRCTTPACGSFVHPTLHRGLTLREAAAFQTFPLQYVFAGGYDAIERQIGNAVPVRMAEALGRLVLDLLAPTEATEE